MGCRSSGGRSSGSRSSGGRSSGGRSSGSRSSGPDPPALCCVEKIMNLVKMYLFKYVCTYLSAFVNL